METANDAIDGDLNSRAHSAGTNDPKWWMVDLGQQFYLYQIQIFNDQSEYEIANEMLLTTGYCVYLPFQPSQHAMLRVCWTSNPVFSSEAGVENGVLVGSLPRPVREDNFALNSLTG